MKKLYILLAILTLSLSHGQWTNDYSINTLVAESQTSDIQSIGTNDGKTYVIFWDEDAGYVLRVQLLDAEGNQLFGSNGIEANSVAQNGSFTVTRSNAVDSDGNLYIGFTATDDGNGYVNKISPSGEQLYGAGGIAIPGAWDLKVLPMSDGGVVVGWKESGRGYLMKYSDVGAPMWAEPLKLDSPNASNPFTGVGELVGLSDGSFIVFLHTSAVSWAIDSIMWAQRFDADGEPMWDSFVKVSTQTLMLNRRYPLLQDGDVTYLGYHGSTGWRFDSFLQRINADGTLPWGEDGAAFSTNDTYLEMTTQIAFKEGDSYIWAMSNFCNDNQSKYGHFVQKFDKETGERLLGDSAKEVFPVNDNSFIGVGDLQLVNGTPFFMFSNGISNGVNSIQLGVAYLDENGDFAWEEETVYIAESPGNKGRFDFTKNVDGQSVAVWTENRNGAVKAYAQNYVVEETAAVSDLNSFSVSLYPNPTKGVVNIQSDKEIKSVEVFGLNGQLLKKVKNTKAIDVSDLAKGVYVIKVTTAEGAYRYSKLVKS